MSSAELKSTRKPHTRLKPREKHAIIAAVTSGLTQAHVAQQFGVHPNTVANLCKAVRGVNNPANPLNEDWKEGFRREARESVLRGMRYLKDPIGAANIGLKAMQGTGDLISGAQVQLENTTVIVQWEPIQECINVTPDCNVCDAQPANGINNLRQDET